MSIGNSDTARATILARIRKAQGKSARVSQAETEAVETYIRGRPRGPLKALDGNLVAHFRVRAEAMQSTTEMVATWSDVAPAAARYLASCNLPTSGCVWPQLASLDWSAAGLSLEPRAAKGEDLVGVTGAFAALAETGTLMVTSGPDTPSGASLLPETHIALVPTRRIVAHMEDAWDLARAELGPLPRAVNFISGPSRTGDIDQTIVLGAHGPYRVHMILVQELLA
ncbi:MAG: lactate utilization protein C [Burkholderiales bacterium]